MNVLIVGLPGNGKGIKAMHLLVEELRLGTRPIITNLAVEKLPWIGPKHKPRRGLQDYLREKYDDDFNCNERIFRVSDEAVQNFYLYRALNKKQIAKLGADHLIGYRQVLQTDGVMTPREFWLHQDYQLYVCDHETRTDKSGRSHCHTFNGKLLELSGPHFNIADECWKFWPARGWQSTSDADVFYNAQHRHFGDDNAFLTQRHNDIDSIIVERCQESIVMTHHGKMSWGMFRQPDLFSESIYNGRPMPSKEPMSRRVFRLDVKGLCEGYDTSAGVGITGRGAADVGARKKGLPFWLMPVLVLGLLVAVCFGLFKGAHFVTGIFAGKKPAPKSPVPVASTNSPKPQKKSAVSRASADSELSRVDGSESAPAETNQVICTGYLIAGNHATAFFSDGSSVDDASGLQRLEKSAVVVAGKRWPIMPAKVAWTPAQYPVFNPDDSVVPMPPVPTRPVNQIDVIQFGGHPSRVGFSPSVASHFEHQRSSLPSSGTAGAVASQ